MRFKIFKVNLNLLTKEAMDWSLSKVNGGKIPDFSHSLKIPGVYSEDGRYFIALFYFQLRVYFVSTRQCTRTIEMDLTGSVDVELDATNTSNIIVYKRNEILTINWKEKVSNALLSKDPIESNITFVIKRFEDKSIMFVNYDSKTKIFNLLYMTLDGNIVRIYETSSVLNYSLSENKEFLVILNDNKEVINLNISRFLNFPPTEDVEDLEVNIKNFNYKSHIISIAVNNDNLIALGSVSGPIQIIFNDGNDNEKLLKWHIGPVKSLIFHENFLISGGDEKVLVIWQIDNDKTQFLPRLNGTIEKLSIDENKPDYYNLLLKINGFNEILCLSAVDLVSRLSVNSIRPNLKKNLTFKNSYSLVDVNPKTGHLYFPNQSMIQVYDLIKNEQDSQQMIADVIPIGKVKSELKLTDPIITLLKFSEDGEWMCTFDIIKNNEVEDLLSANDKNYALKFWRFPSNNSGWELVTKIINPHLLSPVASILPFQSGFITSDSKGNLRLWKLKNKAWVLVKTLDMLKAESKNVNLAKSADNSVVVLSHENVIYIVSPNFQVVETLTLVESNIRSIKIIDEDLIVLSQNKIVSFNLINFSLNDLYGKVNIPSHGSSYLTVNDKIIGLALNIENLNKCKILILNKNSLKPIYSVVHDSYVNSILNYNDSFLIVDNESRIYSISSNELKFSMDSAIKDQPRKPENVSKNTSNDIENVSFKKFDINSFNNIFDTDNLENLFDNIIKIVK